MLDTDVSLFAVGGVLSQLQDDSEVVIAYASRSLRLSQWRYCTTRRDMLAAVVMCTHFRSYLREAQFTLRTDHSSLRWLQRFRNEDGMLARWYLLLGQFSVTFGYRPGLSMRTRMGCPANVASVSGLIVRCRRWIRRSPMSNRKQGLFISLLPRRRWVSLWTRTCCQNYPVKLG